MRALILIGLVLLALFILSAGGIGGYKLYLKKRKEKLLKTVEGKQAVVIVKRVKDDFKILPSKNQMIRDTLIDMHLKDLQEVKKNFSKGDIKLITGEEIDVLILKTTSFKTKDQKDEIFFPPS